MRSVALATIDSTVSAPPAWRQELAGVLGSQPILRVHATIGLFGGAMAGLTSPAFSSRLPGGSALTWGGLTGTVAATGNGGHAVRPDTCAAAGLAGRAGHDRARGHRLLRLL